MAKTKLSPKELMDSVIDLDLLEKRKNNKPKKKEIKQQEEKDVELKWFQKPMLKENFSVIEKDKKLYIHYSEWSSNVYIGPYKNNDEVESIIEMYIKETKKTNILKRKFNTEKIHSIILN